MHLRRLISFLLPLMALGLGACSDRPTVARPTPAPDLSLSATERVITPYRIGAGDELGISFFFAPELNDVMEVRPDGRISLAFVQDMIAAGKTPKELADEIRLALSEHVRQPEVVVVVRKVANNQAYVFGEVTRPGAIPLIRNVNLVQVIAQAGWITPAGRQDEVVLIRRRPNGTEGVHALKLGAVLSGEDVSQNVLINPGDQILVPPSRITELNRWVDQYLRQAVPFDSSIVLTNEVGGR